MEDAAGAASPRRFSEEVGWLVNALHPLKGNEVLTCLYGSYRLRFLFLKRRGMLGKLYP